MFDKSTVPLRSSAEKTREIFGDKKIRMVEVGVASGHNALNLINGLGIDLLFLVEIDVERLMTSTREHLLNRDRNCIYMPMSSFRASQCIGDETMDYVYIDADHSFEAVKNDLELWYPKVKKGCVFGGHDYSNPSCVGVKRAVNHFCDRNGYTLYITDMDWWFVKQ